MSNNNKKKRKKPSGTASTYRAPANDAGPQRRGLLDGIFASRTPGGSPMPKLRSTLARGIETASSQPWLMAGIRIFLCGQWFLSGIEW